MPDKIKKIRGNDPVFSQTKIRGDCRKLELTSGTWQWKTDGYDVTIYDPKGMRHQVSFGTMLGMTPEQWNNHRHFDDQPIPVEPRDIKAYVETVLENA